VSIYTEDIVTLAEINDEVAFIHQIGDDHTEAVQAKRILYAQVLAHIANGGADAQAMAAAALQAEIPIFAEPCL
jgi:hypothetical protein